MSGINRFGFGGVYVLHSDHEAEVARLRAEVEKNRVDAERWDWIMGNYYGGDLARTQKIIGQCWTREQMEAAIDKDLA